MEFPIGLNFDKNCPILFLNLLSFLLIYLYDRACRKRYLYITTNFISCAISLICLFIRKKSTLRKCQEINVTKKTETGIIMYQEKRNKDNEFYLNNEHFIIIIIYFLFNILPFLGGTKLVEIHFYWFYSNTIFCGILLVGFFIHQKIYKHHLISMFVLFLIIFFNGDFSERMKESSFVKNTLGSIIYYISRGALRNYFNYLMLNYFIDPFYISTIDALMVNIKTILNHFYAVIFIEENEKKKFMNANFEWNEFSNTIFLIQFILYSISIIANPILDVLTSYNYTAYHQSLIDVLANFLFAFMNQIEFKNSKINIKINIRDLIIGIINIFFIGVAAKIIILKFWKLNIDTKSEISKRASKDAKIENDPNFSTISTSFILRDDIEMSQSKFSQH